MPVKALTDKTIEALKPEPKRYEVHDLRCPGLSLRVSSTGLKTFYIKFRHGLEQKHPKLGTYPRMSLATAREPLDYRSPPADKSNMARYLFGGFTKCLTNVARFDSDSERKLAVILEREADKWFRPAKGQFQMFYRKGSDHLEYRPDFIAETADEILMLEPKMATQMSDADVLAKRDVAVQWCRWASEHAQQSGGKPWRYALIPHDQIADNMGLDFLLKSYACNG